MSQSCHLIPIFRSKDWKGIHCGVCRALLEKKSWEMSPDVKTPITEMLGCCVKCIYKTYVYKSSNLQILFNILSFEVCTKGIYSVCLNWLIVFFWVNYSQILNLVTATCKKVRTGIHLPTITSHFLLTTLSKCLVTEDSNCWSEKSGILSYCSMMYIFICSTDWSFRCHILFLIKHRKFQCETGLYPRLSTLKFDFCNASECSFTFLLK